MYRILLVEDDTFLRDTLKCILEMDGTAVSGYGSRVV